jgi:2OG-Fe(II) oxygenase superfamily
MLAPTVIRNVLSADVCAAVIRACQDDCTVPPIPALVAGEKLGADYLDARRTARIYPCGMPTVLSACRAAMVNMLNLSLPLSVALGSELSRVEECCESPRVVRYATGGKYLPHYDYLKETNDRMLTAILKLNDDHEGGDTTFPRLGFKFKLPVGAALVWSNYTDDGRPWEGSLHGGSVVTAGEKWIIPLWFRQFPVR